jgi:mannose-6-phosphate isomerase-like protein (cupin superfamily)
MRWCIPPGEEPLFGPSRGCEPFEQRLLTLNETTTFRSGEVDEVVYVVDGRGTLAVDAAEHPLTPGAAAYVARTTPWTVRDADALTLMSVRVHDPEPAGAAYAFVVSQAAEQGTATAGRSFLMLASPGVGCNSVTQFIGLIPPGRAPDHFHRYDEVIYVLEGEGTLEIGGESAPIRPGTCIHLPRTLVHCLANEGETEMRVLGVFRPAGSPAEAYYPDGTRAVVTGSEE